MTVSHKTEYRGRKQRVGSPIFTETGRLNFFIGYCPDCKGKCSVTSDEARKLIKMFYRNQHRPGRRLIIRLLKRYSDAYPQM